jgi:hypothetical protein
MAKIHMVLQGKGGVGKSFIATVIAQYKMSKGQQPLCIDTDPVNATFHGFKALNVRLLEIMQGDEIQTRNFDTLVELIAPSKDDVIIDNGASSFVPLTHYLISNQVPALLQDMGHEMVVHTVITGSQALLDTVSGFAQLASQFPAEALFVVWLNPFWGIGRARRQELRADEGLHSKQGTGVGHREHPGAQGRHLRPRPERHAAGAPDLRRSPGDGLADDHDAAAPQDRQRAIVQPTG